MRFTDAVTRLRAPLVTGPYGDEVRDWSSPEEATVPAVVQPDRQVEETTDEQRTTTWLRVFLPPAADVLVTDRLLWQSRGLDVVRVEPWQDGRGRAHHIEALVRESAWTA